MNQAVLPSCTRDTGDFETFRHKPFFLLAGSYSLREKMADWIPNKNLKKLFGFESEYETCVQVDAWIDNLSMYAIYHGDDIIGFGLILERNNRVADLHLSIIDGDRKDWQFMRAGRQLLDVAFSQYKAITTRFKDPALGMVAGKRLGLTFIGKTIEPFHGPVSHYVKHRKD